MESIKFCAGPFSIFPVMKLLKAYEASYKLICDKWELFGYSLGLSTNEVDSLKEIFTAGGVEIQDIPREVLRLWQDGHDEDVNLKVLYDALIDVKAKDLAVAVREKFGASTADFDVLAPMAPAQKRLRRMIPETSQNGVENDDGFDLNLPDKDGYVPVLRAIRDVISVAYVKKLLDDGANPNVKTDNNDKDNAAHEVIRSLINKKVNIKGAVDILDKLVAKGFNLINEPDSGGFTPLIYAMEFEDLDEELLRWFRNNGADFNAVEGIEEYCVVLQAIHFRQGASIISKILDFGGNPEHVNKDEENALHAAARVGHESALDIFVKKLDVNARNKDGQTPMHLLFEKKDLDYQHCLKLLLRKGANFDVKSNDGHVPMTEWIKYDGGNPFPTLMKMKDRLPITEEIASTALTAIVEEMKSLQECLPSSSRDAQNEFAQFISFLIEDKKATLRLKDEDKWKQVNWGTLNKLILTRNFLNELKATDRTKWYGEFSQIKAENLGKFEFHTDSRSVTVPAETVIVCLLACKKYKALVELCKVLKDFCQSV